MKMHQIKYALYLKAEMGAGYYCGDDQWDRDPTKAVLFLDEHDAEKRAAIVERQIDDEVYIVAVVVKVA
jgi:hypothetical protein